MEIPIKMDDLGVPPFSETPKSSGWNPLSLSPTAKWQCLPNTRFERTVRKLHDPPSARSCIVSHNPDGLFMDSQSHYTKVHWDSWWVG